MTERKVKQQESLKVFERTDPLWSRIMYFSNL